MKIKKDFIPLIIFLVFALFSNMIAAQEFKGNVSGTIGIVNTKIRLQYELPIKQSASTGININYYFIDWTGPVFEPFIRGYGKRNGNTKGFFGQFKLIYGNLKTREEPYPDAFLNKRWSTYGFGLSCGYKILINNKFTFEPLIGFRLLSSPAYKCKPGYSYDCDEMRSNYQQEWLLSTGFPLDFQLKFGIQFNVNKKIE
jgi:hypothetical protein